MASTRAHINPEMLIWARERVNFDPALLARRAGVSTDAYLDWERGEKRPTIKQLQKVAKALRRPVALFYLRQPPEENQPRFEMRRVFGIAPEADSPGFALEVQECVRRREIALELFERLGEVPPDIPVSFTVNDDPEEAGEYAREILGITMKQQVNWKNSHEALRSWRIALESSGTLAFQMSGVPLSEARGFAIADRPLPIAAFNSQDSVHGRIFTLMHEFAHILLGVSVLHARSPLESNEKVELWCNRLAAAILIPRDDLLTLHQVRERGDSAIWLDDEVRAVARRYNVSPAGMIRRLHSFDLIAVSPYETLREEYDSYRASEGSDGGGNFYNNTIAELGLLLPTLAFRSFYADELSIRDLSRIIGTRVVNLGEFETRIKRNSLCGVN